MPEHTNPVVEMFRAAKAGLVRSGRRLTHALGQLLDEDRQIVAGADANLVKSDPET